MTENCIKISHKSCRCIFLDVLPAIYVTAMKYLIFPYKVNSNISAQNNSFNDHIMEYKLKQQNITNFTSFVRLVLQHSYIINTDTELVLVSLSDELCEYTKVRMRLQKPMLYNQTLKGNSLKCILISVYEWYRREGKTKINI